MYLLDVIPLTRTPHIQTQILSYFFNVPLPSGALVSIPLGKRKETGAVIDSHEVSDFKMEIKKAGYELRPIDKIINPEPILTSGQIKLALWLGQYYLASPGIFIKMMLPKSLAINSKSQIAKSGYKPKNAKSKLILAPTTAQADKIAAEQKNAIVWHSGLKEKQLNENWQKIKRGEARLVVGTRSAVFLPFLNLKEILIEDENNPNHRSWDMFPHYRTHEAARKLAELFKAKLTFKSGITSVESFSRAPGSIKLPPNNDVAVVDMRNELKTGNFSIFSLRLKETIENSLAQKKQTVLFINRRGAANFILCRDCGYTAKCANCDSPLAYHLINQLATLFCHRCGHKERMFALCPKCHGYRVKTVGTGTQKVELEAQRFFPQAHLARLDSDSTPEQKQQAKIIENFVKKEFDILIATQIIFSWFNEIKSVQPATAAVIAADTLLHLPDFRSGERTWQIINALRGLAGENFIVQTYNPENQIIRYIAQNDWKSFYQEELETRKALGYPPFSQIVKLTFRHKDPKKAGQEAKILEVKLQNIILAHSVIPAKAGIQDSGSRVKHGMADDCDIQISDALPAFIPKEKGKNIWNIIIKFSISESNDFRFPIDNEFLHRRNSLLQYVPQNWEIDVDPENLL